MISSAQTVLKDVFGYDEFRPLQEDIIKNVLQKIDTLVVMPTGGGKSLCYQLPALLVEGLTVVVSPLISLMKDQVAQLQQLGVPAVFLNSSLLPEEYEQTLARVISGQVKLLYVAPETLLKARILALLANLKVECLAIDEAHCISEWGHDFRPEYRQLVDCRQRFPQAVCIALTATATQRVRQDICATLQFSASQQFVASFDRDNLFLRIALKADPLRQLLEFLEQHASQSGIIYCFSRRQVDDLAEVLKQHGYATRPYHAGLPDVERTKNQEAFLRDDVQIIVATIAFGMGINKSNVRFVIHYDLPKNLESYYQEIGRAGRDGLRSHCLLLLGYGDVAKIRYLIDQKSGAERQVANHHLNVMLGYAESQTCRRVPLLAYFGEQFVPAACEMCDNCLAGQRELVDLTIPAQKFLSCISRTGQKFGANHIIEVLRGSQSEKVLKFGHSNLSTYGIGKEFSKKQWLHLSRQFLQNGLLAQDLEYGGLQLTPKAHEVLRGMEKFLGTVQAERMEEAAGAEESVEYDRGLFDLLRKLRKELADEQNVPPYVVFPDKTLTEMAAYFPQSRTSLRRMHGVGEAKLEKYGTFFLQEISRYCREHGLQEKSRSTKEFTATGKLPTADAPVTPKTMLIAEAFNAGKSLTELTQQFEITSRTILEHLYKSVRQGRVLRVEGLVECSRLDPVERDRVLQAFEKLGPDFLRPVFQALNEKVSYDELHVLRLYYLSELNVRKEQLA
ncbi:MAG: DNA helicase RecQ [bacterium]